MWEANGQSVLKKDKEKTEGSATTSRNARSQATPDRSRERHRVTGGRDEL